MSSSCLRVMFGNVRKLKDDLLQTAVVPKKGSLKQAGFRSCSSLMDYVC